MDELSGGDIKLGFKDMSLIFLLLLLLSCCVCSPTFTDSTESVLFKGEQRDLIGFDDVDFHYQKPPPADGRSSEIINDAGPHNSLSGENQSTQGSSIPEIEARADSEPFDEVERIEPRQWQNRPDVPSTREAAFPTATDASLLPRRGLYPPTLAQRNPQSFGADERQFPTATAPPMTTTIEEAFCDFGPVPVQSLCEWQDGCGALKWTPGTGIGTNWLGGPPSDSTSGTMEGGYAFLETSYVPAPISKEIRHTCSPGGLLHSPLLATTGVTGTCLTFKFAFDGLSSAGLRILLHSGVDEVAARREAERANAAAGDNFNNATTVPGTLLCKPVITTPELDRVIWQAQYHYPGTWQQAQILYTHPGIHSLIFEGIPVDSNDPSRLYRGYVAIDDIDLQAGSSCVGFCNFAGGFCDWSNDAEDDFEWTISRGSNNPTTGPTMDSSADRSTAGGYAYIDSGYPRRPGDTARLLSNNFPATASDAPMCLHFWFHMFGAGTGQLNIYLRHTRSLEAQLQKIWSLSGNAGNAWFASQVTVSSLDDFQLVFEASVGDTGLGDIAIDDISFTIGACPTAPQVSASIPRDCTFEIDDCDWINTRDPTRVEWERVSSQLLPPKNHRRPFSNGYTINRRNEYFLSLQGRPGGRAASNGGTAQLISRQMTGSPDPTCVTFWFLMFEPFIDSAGPSLGTLRLSIQTVGEGPEDAIPMWQLYNNQGPSWVYGQTSFIERRDFNVIFEGTWGPNRSNGHIAIDDIAFYTGNCTVNPRGAAVRREDCSFEKGLCGWENITSNNGIRGISWQQAFFAHRPAQLVDKTFGASGDFVFFDIFTTDQKANTVRLQSPVINISPDEESMCFSFWFAAFGVEETTSLRVIKINIGESDAGTEDAPDDEDTNNKDEETLWSLTAKGFNNPRPSWIPAQVLIEARSPYRLVLEGSASNGGFAVDDIRFQTQVCATRPPAAQHSTAMPSILR